MIEHLKVGEAVNALDFAWCATEHEGLSPRQRTANGFIGLTAHDEYLPHGGLLKPFEVFWQVPGDIALITNDTIFCHGGDCFESFHVDNIEADKYLE